uniref:Uncharacterized protein n=1 Tax=Acrobeloides nanus TaxID=290746 RepID=A0A914E3L6_9BILA
MAIVALKQAQSFDIPLPLGAGIAVDKQPDGQTQVSLGQNVNILGFGGNRNVTFTGGNGTFSTQTDNNLLVNGTKIGGGSTIGADKNKGVTLDNDVNLGNKTIQGGVGNITT